MANWKVTFTTYEEYEVEAETEEEAFELAQKKLANDRCRPPASTWYDESEIECLDE